MFLRGGRTTVDRPTQLGSGVGDAGSAAGAQGERERPARPLSAASRRQRRPRHGHTSCGPPGLPARLPLAGHKDQAVRAGRQRRPSAARPPRTHGCSTAQPRRGERSMSAGDTSSACPPATTPAADDRTLRSRPGSALIEDDDSRPSGHAPQRRRSRSGPSRSQAPRDPLEGAPVVVSIEHTKPGSPLDEHLRREQTRALLDLLADHVARQRKRNPKAARRF